VSPASPAPRVVVFGWGNPSRGDDALGPELLARAERLAPPTLDVRFVPAFQLAPEDALELVDRDLALFVDASCAGAHPVELRRVGAASASSFTSHVLSPEGVLELYRSVTRAEPPQAYVLAVRGESFELGEGLSILGRAHLEAATRVLAALFDDADPAAWEARARGPEEA
jgi:hydrogenase maturation protease